MPLAADKDSNFENSGAAMVASVGRSKAGAHVRGATSAEATKKAKASGKPAGPKMQSAGVVSADQLDRLCQQTRSQVTSLTTKLGRAADGHFTDILAEAGRLIKAGNDPTGYTWTLTESVAAPDAKAGQVAALAFEKALANAGRGHRDFRLTSDAVQVHAENGKAQLTAKVRLTHASNEAYYRIHERLKAVYNNRIDKAGVSEWTHATVALVSRTLIERAQSVTGVSGDIFAEPIPIGTRTTHAGEDVLRPRAELGDVPVMQRTDDFTTNDVMNRLRDRLHEAFKTRGIEVDVRHWHGSNVEVTVARAAKGRRD